MAELAGVLIGNYFLLECLAREGMVETYRARPTTRGGYDVILRLFRPEFPDPTAFREQFAGEVEKVWRCHSEHIQPLLEFGTGDDLLYYATLIPEAETLEQFLKRQPERFLPLSVVVSVVTQACEALQYCHEQNIVHGNIQPASLLVSKEGTVLLTSFSMKRAYQDGEPLAAQIDEGSAAYVAPEQALGMICPSSDIYAVGVLLYRLLGGMLPYDGKSAGEIALKHANEPIPSLRALQPELPEAIERVVRQALSKTPKARFSSAAEISRALHAALVPGNEQVISASPERRIEVRAQRTGFPWARIASMLTLSVLLFGLGGASWFVLSFPRSLNGDRSIWSVVQSRLFGRTPGNSTVPLQLTPPELSGTSASGSTSAVKSTPPGTIARTPLTSGTVTSTPIPSPTPISTSIICTSGNLSIDGSSSLEPLLQQVSSDYSALCPAMSVSLGGDGSRIGLNDVEQNMIDAASSDLTARPSRNLSDQPVAAMLYAIIVNPDVQVGNLSASAIQAIYQGRITNWLQLGGHDEAITVFQHPAYDSAAAIFRVFMLNGRSEHVKGQRLQSGWVQAVAQTPGSISYVPLAAISGAGVSVLSIDGVRPSTRSLIQGEYPFWSVEHLYTVGSGTSQFQAYLPFLASTQESYVFAQYGAVPVSMMPQNVLASHLPGPEI